MVAYLMLAGLGANAFAQTSQLTVMTDSPNYETGDTVTISGDVGTVREDQQLLIQVWNPNGVLYRADPVQVSPDGSYSYEMKVGGRIGISGEYRVVVDYDQTRSETTFDFTSTESADAEVVIDGQSHTFRIRGGGGLPSWFKGAHALPESNSLVIELDTFKEETLELELDNSLIATDEDCFVTHVDGEEVESQCTQIDADTTLLQVTIPPGASELAITGSFLAPEFGPVLAIILASTIAAIIVVSRSGRLMYR
jgi:hypothetical protein